MTNSQLFRISGLVLVVGAVVFIVHSVARSMITAGTDPATVAKQGLWIPMSALGVLGAALVLLGIPAIYARMSGSSGWLGLIGIALITIAWLFFGVFLSLYSMLVVPWLAEEAPSLVAASARLPTGIIIAFIVGLIAELIGSVLLAIPFIRSRVEPYWIGYILPTAALMTVVGNFIAPTGPATNLAINLLSNLGPMLLMAALGYLGWRMWLEQAPAGQAGAALERGVGRP